MFGTGSTKRNFDGGIESNGNETISECAVGEGHPEDAKDTHGVATRFLGRTECDVSIWKCRSVGVESDGTISTRTLAERGTLVRVTITAQGFPCDEEGSSSEGEGSSCTRILFLSFDAVRELFGESGLGVQHYVLRTALRRLRGACAGERRHRTCTSLGADLSSVPYSGCTAFPVIVGVRPHNGKSIPTSR